MKTLKVALFNETMGQITQYLPVNEALNFPCSGIGHVWYQDAAGNRYSTYQLMSLTF